MNIGPYQLASPVILAPMAGITDQPFRQLCRQLGAGLAVSEMVSSNPDLRNSRKTQLRLNHTDESAPISVQIAGTEAQQMAEAARYNMDRGAQIIDLNMGCPAKKVCNVAAGSALLKDEKKVADILQAVVNAVDIPVTLKIRTGWDKENKNAVDIAKIAESSGIQALTIHGRTRECKFNGEVEYDTIAEVKTNIQIPVIANGDIDSPEKAKQVLDYTNADAIMIGRAAQGRPWIFREINYFLETGQTLAPPALDEISELLQNHLINLHLFYGEYMGVRIARKHINWYCKQQQGAEEFRKRINTIENPAQQLAEVVAFFQKQKELNIAA
ncbi:MAG: tRNA dihydrouridine synthase DusB [Gammaproteobacteria bacterium]|nr:tRNA dihydrouridine synthase DusB [Gammaproteobacteria bacterium]MCW9056365.1 tRNA dihydrouridine synthase DusB [Gammaproteobacteria bacterium]